MSCDNIESISMMIRPDKQITSSLASTIRRIGKIIGEFSKKATLSQTTIYLISRYMHKFAIASNKLNVPVILVSMKIKGFEILLQT